MRNGNQSSTAAEARAADRKRAAEIDAANAERARHFSPTPKYGWERQRDSDADRDARIKALERALVAAERKVARQAVTIRSYRRQKGETLEGVVFKAIGKRGKMPAALLAEVEDSFGAVSMRVLMRVLAELVKAKAIERARDGYVRCAS